MTRYFEIRPELKKYFANEGTFTDPRDGNVYKTVEINGQTWLAENLRYEGVDVEFRYPNNDPKKTKSYGCLYDWYSLRTACPQGWHLPTEEEIRSLLKTAGKDKHKQAENLKAQEWNGTDKLEFGALPAGYYASNNDSTGGLRYVNFGSCAYFWINADPDYTYNSSDAFGLYINNLDTRIIQRNKRDCFSLRCIKD